MQSINDTIINNIGVLAMLEAVCMAGLIVGIIMLGKQLQQARHHYQMLLTDANQGNLEQILNRLFGRLDQLGSNVNQLGSMQQNMRTQLTTTMQKLAVIRFNPFEDTGGDQSFAIALLDEHDNGVVLSSLHARESTRVYAKPVQGGKSTFTLADEEKEVLLQAMGQKQTKQV
jgi:hypothetical protein